MRGQYLVIGLLILVILGLGCLTYNQNNNNSNIISNNSNNSDNSDKTNIISNNSEKTIPTKGELPNVVTNKYRDNNSNSSNPTTYNPNRNEYLNDNNASSDVDNIEDNNTDNTTDSNGLSTDNDSFFNEDIGKNVTWEIKISGTTGMMFNGAYVDRYGPPKYVTDNIPKEYTVLSDILAVKFQKSKKEDNGSLTIEIMRDGEKIVSNSTEYSLAYVCKTECYVS